jgi:hypothetical protein
MSRLVPGPARRLASRLDALFGQDAALARRLDAAQEQLHQANDRLWSGLHPDGLATVCDQHPAAIDVAFDVHRSEALGARDPLVAVQQVQLANRSRLYGLPNRRRRTPAVSRRDRRAHSPVRGCAGRRRLVRGAGTQHRRPRTREQQTRKPKEELRMGMNNTRAAVRDGWHAPRPGDGRACTGKPRPPAPSRVDALDARRFRCRVT